MNFEVYNCFITLSKSVIYDVKIIKWQFFINIPHVIPRPTSAIALILKVWGLIWDIKTLCYNLYYITQNKETSKKKKKKKKKERKKQENRSLALFVSTKDRSLHLCKANKSSWYAHATRNYDHKQNICLFHRE